MGTPVVLKNVPADDVDRVVEILKISGATNVQKIKDNGTFTVKFTQPDD